MTVLLCYYCAWGRYSSRRAEHGVYLCPHSAGGSDLKLILRIEQDPPLFI